MAGVPGFEPGYLVLETRVLPLDDTPKPAVNNNKDSLTARATPAFYFFASLCRACFLQVLQNFFNANFRSTVFLFFRVK